MDWVYYSLLLVILLVGYIAAIIGLPGLWVMVLAAMGYAWGTHWTYLATKGLIALASLALLAEIFEFIAGSAGAKRAGASKRGMFGALIGALIGGVVGSGVFPIVGTVIGALAGAFVGGAVVEMMIGKEIGASVRVGVGAAKGRFVGVVIKAIIGLAILILALVLAFP